MTDMESRYARTLNGETTRAIANIIPPVAAIHPAIEEFRTVAKNIPPTAQRAANTTAITSTFLSLSLRR